MSDYARRAQGQQRGIERVLVALLVAMAVLAAVAAALLLLPPALRVTRYEVSGNASLTRDEVLAAALIHEKEYYFALDAGRVAAAVMAEPRVASAKAEKVFPNCLRIAVTERRPVASVLVSANGRARAACVDAEGVAYAFASAAESSAMPVLSGLRFEGFRFGTRLPSSVSSLLATLGRIGEEEPAILASISEIRIVAPYGAAQGAASAAPELLIYPLNERIPVRANASLDAPTLRSILLVLDVLGTRGIAASVSEIDFRTGTVVYRGKEGRPE
jgi:hypothetical protein